MQNNIEKDGNINPEIEKSVYQQGSWIKYLSLFLGVFFGWYGIVASPNEPYKIFSLVIGAIFILVFLMRVTRGDFLNKRDIHYYEKNKKVFDFNLLLLKISNFFIKVRIIYIVMITVIVLGYILYYKFK